MADFELNQLCYARTGKGPWRLYIYDAEGYHGGGFWFRRGAMQYPEEEISWEEAWQRTALAMVRHQEVRITNAGDELVFHGVNGQVVYGIGFWQEVSNSVCADVKVQ